MSIRNQLVRLQDVDKPVEVAKLFNEIFANLRELAKAKEPQVEKPKAVPPKVPEPKKKGKRS